MNYRCDCAGYTGVLGDEQSALSDRFKIIYLLRRFILSAEYKGWKVPDILFRVMK